MPAPRAESERVDSQTVKTWLPLYHNVMYLSPTVKAATHGGIRRYDGGRRLCQRKRHGWLKSGAGCWWRASTRGDLGGGWGFHTRSRPSARIDPCCSTRLSRRLDTLSGSLFYLCDLG
ncbi:protein of unknown function [Candidatus Methylocalor cossyra]|uniref:Uncharacterized protein n=1 Tax=Candidatus Methylocalor cossyra TaxID=3108543 RepID=A0ABP1CCA8_9GAMM